MEIVREKWPFEMDRSMESIRAIEDRVEVNKNGDYKKKPNDWDEREGCTRPMSGQRQPDGFPLTHKVSLSSWTNVTLSARHTLTIMG